MPRDLPAAAPAAPTTGSTAERLVVQLAGPTDWAGFVRVARVLVRDGVAAEQVRWVEDHPQEQGTGISPCDDLFDMPGGAVPAHQWPAAPPLHLSADWVALARTAALHASPQRWALIYRLAARIHADPGLAADPLDADLRQLDRLAQAVRRAAHKMKAFVRFRPVGSATGAVTGAAANAATDAVTGSAVGAAVGASVGDVCHIAWFEPEHHVQERVAPFFTRRFTQMHWAILTPRISLAWDGHTLSHLPGARHEDAPGADDGEALWLAYYRSIFNPARVKVAMMKREMPVRYWPNLPEAQQIAQLLQQAPQRTAAMLTDGVLPSAQRERPRSRAVDAAVAGLPSAQARRAGEGECEGECASPGCVPAVPAAGTAASAAASMAVGAPDHAAPRTADAAQVLAALARRAAQCRGCALADCATQTVWGEGAADARLMLVGEQPGDREDLAGRPFVGPAGQLLRHALAHLGWNERRLYLTNAVKHFKHELRGKRRIHKTASQQEAAACIDWLEAEIDTVQPDVLVALGATAARSLLGRAVAISDPAGPWWQRADGRPVLVVLHPSALLRRPDGERPAALLRWYAQLGEVDARAGPAADWRLAPA